MTSTAARETPTEQATHVDVLIVGAGLSGVGAAYRIQQQHPSKSYAVLESRSAIGGTWDLFRYPGVRSDSDMFTLSYPFRPWLGAKSMADGASIRDYITQTAAEGGIEGRIRFGTRVVSADWSSADALWSVETVVGAESRTYTCSFLYVCAGYYSYEHGHQPDFPGLESFEGRVVHPQAWPDDLDYVGKRVVVIGSGATAVTLVPALADKAAKVTMLQRSPTYVSSLPSIDRTADKLRRRLPAQLAHTVVRVKNAATAQGFYQLCRRRPETAKRLLRKGQLHYLDDAALLDQHFSPTYQPWDQRLCFIPSGDLFKAIRSGKADVVTDVIDEFVPSGVRVGSGATLEADIVVSATGLSLLPIGGMTLSVDGVPVDLGDRFAYRGMMLDGVPNLAYCIGYTNASWTLRADLVSLYVCRLLAYMDKHAMASASPRTPDTAAGRPLLNLTSGYVRRSIDSFPKQGARDPWTVRQNWLIDRLAIPRADVRKDMDFVRRGDLPRGRARAGSSAASPAHGSAAR